MYIVSYRPSQGQQTVAQTVTTLLRIKYYFSIKIKTILSFSPKKQLVQVSKTYNPRIIPIFV